MASYKIYFLNFCYQNRLLNAVAKTQKLHFAIPQACFIGKVDFWGACSTPSCQVNRGTISIVARVVCQLLIK